MSDPGLNYTELSSHVKNWRSAFAQYPGPPLMTTRHMPWLCMSGEEEQCGWPAMCTERSLVQYDLLCLTGHR